MGEELENMTLDPQEESMETSENEVAAAEDIEESAGSEEEVDEEE